MSTRTGNYIHGAMLEPFCREMPQLSSFQQPVMVCLPLKRPIVQTAKRVVETPTAGLVCDDPRPCRIPVRGVPVVCSGRVPAM